MARYMGDIDHINNCEGEIKQHVGIVIFVIYRYFKNIVKENPANWDDAFSCGLIGLWKGLQSYKPEMNVKLSYYLSQTVRNAIIWLWVRKNARWSKVKNETDFKNDDFDNDNNVLDSDMILDRSYEDEDIGLTDLEIKMLQGCKRMATDIQKQIIDLLAKGYTHDEIGRRIGRSRSVIGGHLDYLRKKLRAAFMPELIETGQRKKYFS